MITRKLTNNLEIECLEYVKEYVVKTLGLDEGSFSYCYVTYKSNDDRSLFDFIENLLDLESVKGQGEYLGYKENKQAEEWLKKYSFAFLMLIKDNTNPKRAVVSMILDPMIRHRNLTGIIIDMQMAVLKDLIDDIEAFYDRTQHFTPLNKAERFYKDFLQIWG